MCDKKNDCDCDCDCACGYVVYSDERFKQLTKRYEQLDTGPFSKTELNLACMKGSFDMIKHLITNKASLTNIHCIMRVGKVTCL